MQTQIIEPTTATGQRPQARHTSPWLDSIAAAEYIGCTAETLKTWRSRGEGPKYHIINQKLVRYNIDDLDAFVRGEVAR